MATETYIGLGGMVTGLIAAAAGLVSALSGVRAEKRASEAEKRANEADERGLPRQTAAVAHKLVSETLEVDFVSQSLVRKPRDLRVNDHRGSSSKARLPAKHPA